MKRIIVTIAVALIAGMLTLATPQTAQAYTKCRDGIENRKISGLEIFDYWHLQYPYAFPVFVRKTTMGFNISYRECWNTKSPNKVHTYVNFINAYFKTNSGKEFRCGGFKYLSMDFKFYDRRGTIQNVGFDLPCPQGRHGASQFRERRTGTLPIVHDLHNRRGQTYYQMEAVWHNEKYKDQRQAMTGGLNV